MKEMKSTKKLLEVKVIDARKMKRTNICIHGD